MRYIWNMYHEYREGLGGVAKRALVPVAHYLRWWDAISANRVDRFVANSSNVARRIRRYYGRPSDVVHPPVAVDDFPMSRQQIEAVMLARHREVVDCHRRMHHVGW